MKTKPIEVALLGAGPRGELTLGGVVARFPKEMKFTAVADPNKERRDFFVKRFKIPPQNVFETYDALLDKPQLADAIINTLPCRFHYDSTMKSLDKGYHILLEKPVSHTPEECFDFLAAAKKHNKIFMVALQMKYNSIYQKAKKLIDSGKIGPLMNVDCIENMGYFQMTSMFVRGVHARSSHTHSLTLVKSIHDIDLVNWIVGSKVKRVSSFGSLLHFKKENAPKGAPAYCIDGCPVEKQCRYSAIKDYLKPGRPDVPLSLILKGASLSVLRELYQEPRYRTLAALMSNDVSKKSVLKALKGPYGRCVYHCDNDVADNQTISLEFENGVTASMSVTGHSLVWERTLNFNGVKGEVRTQDFSGQLEVRTYMPGKVQKKRVPFNVLLHGGGDEGIMLDFVKQIRSGKPGESIASIEAAVESHFVAFAVEEARRTGQVVDVEKFKEAASKSAAQAKQKS